MVMDRNEGNDADGARQRIEHCFRRIETERMAGIPILNPAIRVEVVGLDRFGSEWLCILVTPWFMNIVLIPISHAAAEAGGTSPSAAVGSKSTVAFPAGGFEMIHGHEEGIGHYRMCSLFSPMHDFADHESAILAAQSARAALFEDDADRDVDTDMAMIWRGERPLEHNLKKPATDDDAREPSVAASHGREADEEKPDAGLSRRSLFLGRPREEPGQ